jgi:hypothetical protein
MTNPDDKLVESVREYRKYEHSDETDFVFVLTNPDATAALRAYGDQRASEAREKALQDARKIMDAIYPLIDRNAIRDGALDDAALQVARCNVAILRNKLGKTKSELAALRTERDAAVARAVSAEQDWANREADTMRLGVQLEDAERENSALAADQCHDGYGDERGNHRCKEIDLRDAKLVALRAQLAQAQRFLGFSERVLLEQLAQAREALEPFAGIAHAYNGTFDDDDAPRAPLRYARWGMTPKPHIFKHGKIWVAAIGDKEVACGDFAWACMAARSIRRSQMIRQADLGTNRIADAQPDVIREMGRK